MLTRFYANNYRTLATFEIKFDSMAVYCGANGTGKSSMFDAIKFVRDLAIGKCFLGGLGEDNSNIVSKLDFTSWIKSSVQEFEIEFAIDGRQFSYIIHLEQIASKEPRIIKEIARCNGKELYTRELSGVKFGNGAGFPLDWRQAALPSIQSANDDWRDIRLLQDAFANLVILRPNVRALEQESKLESRFPNHDLSNLTSWYRHMAQDQDWTDVLREALQGVWPDDFRSLKLNDAGISAKWLELKFQGAELRFDQLSDGEKMLVGLYMIYAALNAGNVNTVLIDEPDNHVSLQELQPWLLSIGELIDENRQMLIISHSSEILESNPSRSIYFWRDNHSSPTRIGEMKVPKGLTIGEALARGWMDDSTNEVSKHA
jgi:ABC-type cobalamin/Fe3+-siderophores transport system ATPase subunit